MSTGYLRSLLQEALPLHPPWRRNQAPFSSHPRPDPGHTSPVHAVICVRISPLIPETPGGLSLCLLHLCKPSTRDGMGHTAGA